MATPADAAAQFGQPQAQRRSPWGIALEVHALTGTFEPRADGPYSFPAQGWGFALGGGFTYNQYFLLGGDAGVAFFAADRSYPPSPATVDAARTTHALVGSLYVGMISPALPASRDGARKVWLGANLGRARWIGERRLDPCIECDSLAMRMRAGPYIEPFVVYGVGDVRQATGFRLAYRYSFADYASIQHTVRLGLYVALFRL